MVEQLEGGQTEPMPRYKLDVVVARYIAVSQAGGAPMLPGPVDVEATAVDGRPCDRECRLVLRSRAGPPLTCAIAFPRAGVVQVLPPHSQKAFGDRD